jgi:predicted ATPase
MFSASEPKLRAQVFPTDDLNDLRVAQVSEGDDDTLCEAAGHFARQSIYCFRAERFALATHYYGHRSILLPNAENLAEVLNVLQGQPARFVKFNTLLRKVFPSIRYVSVVPGDGKFELMMSNADTPEGRDDLMFPLSESGTGVGQVLAILYIIVTSHSPRAILIDEPNAFLHPGAVRQLFEIMKANPVEHQYVIATHSPEIVRATEARHVYLVEHEHERSDVRYPVRGHDPLSANIIRAWRSAI